MHAPQRQPRIRITAIVLALAVGLVLSMSCSPRAGTPSSPLPPPTAKTKASPAQVKPAPAPRPAATPTGPVVAVLSSEPTFKVSGWLGRWETEGGINALRHLGLRVRVVSDADLAAGRLQDARVLIVPNARCVSRAAAQAVERFVEGGGRLMATGMASYRDESNRRVGDANEFQWSDLFGASFRRWLSGWPRCEYLRLEPSLEQDVTSALALPKGQALPSIQLGRNTAMLIAPKGGATVLATWLDGDGKTPTADAGGSSAAIVQASEGRVIYCGENLLAPELIRSRQVQGLVLALLTRLQDAAPKLAGPAFPTRIAVVGPVPFAFPRIPVGDVPPSSEVIRVGIRADAESLGVGGPSGVRFTGLAMPLAAAPGTKLKDGVLTVPAGQVCEIRAVSTAMGTPYLAIYGTTRMLARAPGGLTVAGGRESAPVQVLDLRPNGTSRIQAFRGALELKQQDERFSVVNVLGLEAYVAGVVPNEVPGSYPPEALKAMAVIARTFSLSRVGFHGKDGHDVCSTVHCQVYGGMLTEWESSTRAVTQTAGEVLRYGDRAADATFHAVCGGVGEDVERVWPQPPSPYLVGSPDAPSRLGDLSDDAAFRDFIDRPPDAYCENSPRFRWTETYTLPQLQALFEVSLPVTLGSTYTGLGTLQDVHITRRSPLGRVQAMQIVGSKGVYTVEKDKIRWLWSGGRIGQGGLQSTLFYIDRDGGRRVFRGGGWGHGVGMCQDGAAGRALRGLLYPAIIDHYYPGTRLVRAALPMQSGGK